jgi:hypothetical protein
MGVLLELLLARLLTVLGIAQATQAIVEIIKQHQPSEGVVAVEHSPFRIQTDVDAIETLATDPGYGLQALKDHVLYLQSSMQDPHLANLTDILAAITGLPTVTLPTTPPDGYGGTTFGPVISWQMCSLD